MLLHDHESKSFGSAVEHSIVQHHTTAVSGRHFNFSLCFITNQMCQTTENISFGLGQLQNVSFDISGSDPTTNYWLIVATYKNGDTDHLNRTRYVLIHAEIFFIAEAVLMTKVLSNEILYKVCSMYIMYI